MVKAKRKSSPRKISKEKQRPTSVRQTLSQALDLAIRPAAKEIGLALAAEIQSFRQTRWLKLRDYWEHEIRAKELSPDDLRHLPTGLLAKVIRQATEEDDDRILSMWAKLLASASDPKSDPSDKVYFDIVSALSWGEVLILRTLWRGAIEADLNGLSADRKAIAIENLTRLRCIRLQIDAHTFARLEEPGSFTMRDDGGGTLRDINASFEYLKHSIDDLSGRNDPVYHGRHPDQSVPLTAAYELTELGAALMRLCEPKL